MSEFVPRHVHPYRVPAVFKDEVDRQIAELLSMGLILARTVPWRVQLFTSPRRMVVYASVLSDIDF